ncbi:MAG: ROK family protein [Candidatus Omnitrophota bacterium]
MKQYIIGVDIGGTKIAAGVIDNKGTLKEKIFVPTLAGKGSKTSLNQVYLAIQTLLDKKDILKKDIKGIGVCAPGPLDPKKGIVHNPPNLPGWKEIPLVSLIRAKFRLKTRLENDANAAGMAEMLWGSAKGYKNVFYVTVSTGIGTGIIINGKIYHGKNGMAGEGGHVTINYDDKSSVCNCGNIACIETLASGPSTAKRLIEKLKNKKNIKTSVIKKAGGDLENITMLNICEAAKEGDKLALDMVSEQANLLGVWLGSMISVLDPEIIVIGGGVLSLGEILLRPVRKAIPQHTINIYAEKTPVVQAKLKKDVGIFGAASIMMDGE